MIGDPCTPQKVAADEIYDDASDRGRVQLRLGQRELEGARVLGRRGSSISVVAGNFIMEVDRSSNEDQLS